ncbi:hypothetical protein [Bdellovibrio bacteriovorus]
MKNWEYKKLKIETVNGDSMVYEFNALGKDGWELVLVMAQIAIFKRPLA